MVDTSNSTAIFKSLIKNPNVIFPPEERGINLNELQYYLNGNIPFREC